MNSVPDLFLVDSQPGADFEERWSNYIKTVYQRYLQSVAFGDLRFRGLPVRCQFRPETHGKHYAFWHMIQEGSGGRVEDERTPDLRRCERIDWIAWCIRAAETGVSEIRV